MKKALLPLLIASALPAAAFADVTVYGKANVSWQNVDKENGGTYTELVSNASRIGLKGSDAINDDIKGIYMFEYETKPDDGANSQTCSATSTSTTTAPAATTKTTTTCSVSGQTFSQRNIYVGLQGVGGTVTAGMFDTPLKASQEKVDLFNDLAGDLKSVLIGEIRAKNVVQYTSPAFANITGTFAYVNTETDTPEVSNGYSASIAYNTKTIYVAIANDHNVQNALDKKAVPGDTHDTIRATGRFTVGPVQLGAMYETYHVGKVDEAGYLVSAQWNVTDKFALKLQNVQSDMIVIDSKSTSFGVDYKYSKATKVFGYYTKVEDGNLTKTSVKDDEYLGVGIELNF